MPRYPRTTTETKPSQFRLGPAALADLHRVADWLAATLGQEKNLTDAVKYAITQAAQALPAAKTNRRKSG